MNTMSINNHVQRFFYVCSRNIGVNIKYKCLTNIYLYLDFIRISAPDFANLELVE
jgi:hypothetical protein